MSKQEIGIEVITEQQQVDINAIQNAFKAAQKTTIDLFQHMWEAGKAAKNLTATGLTQVQIAEKAQVTQPFICQSIKFYGRFPRFTVTNPPKALQGKTMKEVWHEVLVRKHHLKTIPLPTQTQSPVEPTPPTPAPLPTPSQPTDEDMKKMLQPYLELEYVQRLHNIATEFNYTVTELVARLIVMSIKNNSNSQIKGWLPPKSAPQTVQVLPSA